MKPMRFNVTAVVVSYNREQLLGECLDGLAVQTRPADRVIVVDNASTDHALQVAREHPINADVIALPHNVGGAGGFCAGMAEAVDPKAVAADHGTAHYVWIMDDDTIPTPTALENLLQAAQESLDVNHALPTILGSKALWVDGREHLMNKPRPRTWVRKGAKTLDGMAGEGAYQARSLSFVSCLINAGAIVGLNKLPRSAYFLWNDDFEFTTALLKHGIGYYVPASEVVHKTKVFGSSDADPGQRFYNEVRNKLWLFRLSRSNFTAAELAEFLLKTVRRWALTYLRSENKEVIVDCFKRGWHDGWHTDPQTNAELFADVPRIARRITAIEG